MSESLPPCRTYEIAHVIAGEQFLESFNQAVVGLSTVASRTSAKSRDASCRMNRSGICEDRDSTIRLLAGADVHAVKKRAVY
jgi:hypothetical protein